MTRSNRIMNRNSRSRAVWLYLFSTALVFSLSCEDTASEDIEIFKPNGIYEGEWVESQDSGWKEINRATVGLDADKCGGHSCGSGLLVAPRLVLTAAHNGYANCAAGNGTTGETVEFGIDTHAGTRDQQVDVVEELDFPNYQHYYNPNGCGTGTATDIGLWVLEHPPSVALPYANFGGKPTAKNNSVMGYGFGDSGLPHADRGVLRRAENCELKAGTLKEWFLKTGESEGNRFVVNGCADGAHSEAADSGSPIFDADMHIVGVNTGRRGGDFGGVWVGNDTSGTNDDISDGIESTIDEFKTELRIADFNGDGRQDLLYWNNQYRGSWVDYADPNGEYDGVPDDSFNFCNLYNGHDRELFVGYFDADDRADVLCFDRDTRDFYIKVHGPSGLFSNTYMKFFQNWCGQELFIGDFNGDGYDDLYCREGNVRKVEFNRAATNPTAPFNGSTEWSVSSGWCRQQLHIGDFNRDGRDDVFCWNPQTRMYIKYAQNNEAQVFSAPHVYRTTAWCNGDILFADFDADGDDDLACWNRPETNLSIDWAYQYSDGRFPFRGTNWRDYDYSWCKSGKKSYSTSARLAKGMGPNAADLYCYDDRTGMVKVEKFSSRAVPFDGSTEVRFPHLTAGLWP